MSESDIDVAEQIMVAVDACDERKYAEAKKILAGVPMVILRTRDSGVHYGYLTFIANAQHGTYRAVLRDARRLWSWQGANTLHEVSADGVASAKASKSILRFVIPQVIEVIPCTAKAAANLASLKW